MGRVLTTGKRCCWQVMETSYVPKSQRPQKKAQVESQRLKKTQQVRTPLGFPNEDVWVSGACLHTQQGVPRHGTTVFWDATSCRKSALDTWAPLEGSATATGQPHAHPPAANHCWEANARSRGRESPRALTMVTCCAKKSQPQAETVVGSRTQAWSVRVRARNERPPVLLTGGGGDRQAEREAASTGKRPASAAPAEENVPVSKRLCTPSPAAAAAAAPPPTLAMLLAGAPTAVCVCERERESTHTGGGNSLAFKQPT
jgi:hypothetical protein